MPTRENQEVSPSLPLASLPKEEERERKREGGREGGREGLSLSLTLCPLARTHAHS